MADSSTGNQTSLEHFLREAWAPAVASYLNPLVDLASLTSDYSAYVDNNVVHIPSANALSAQEKTDGTALTASAIDDNDLYITLSHKVATYIIIEDPVKFMSNDTIIDDYAKNSAAAIAVKIGDLIQSAIAGQASNSVTLSTANTVTAAEFRTGIADLLPAKIRTGDGNTVLAANPTVYTGMLGTSDFNTYEITGSKQVAEGLRGYGIGIHPDSEWSTAASGEAATMWHKSAIATAMLPVPRTITSAAPEHLGWKIAVYQLVGYKVLFADRMVKFINPSS